MTTPRPAAARKSAVRPNRAPAKAAPAPKAPEAKKKKDKKKPAGKDALISQLKQRSERLGTKARKSSLQLAGLRLLAAQGDAELLAALKAASPR